MKVYEWKQMIQEQGERIGEARGVKIGVREIPGGGQ